MHKIAVDRWLRAVFEVRMVICVAMITLRSELSVRWGFGSQLLCVFC